ncbi:MAG: hypothetical protein U0235_13500 [Polyangiaceae bacterium]
MQATEAERARQAHAEHARQRAELMARAELDAAAQQSLLWSLGALLLCCVPGPQIMALVRFAAARKAARALGVPVPAKATTGMVFALVSIVLGVTTIVWSIVRADTLEKQANKRLAELEPVVARAESPLLDRGTACGLAEQAVLKDGFGGERGYSFEAFECVGKLTATSERATLEDFRFKKESNDENLVVTVCFKRGAKWYVAAVSKGPCGDSDGSPDAGGAEAPGMSAAPRTSGPAPRTTAPSLAPSARPARR